MFEVGEVVAKVSEGAELEVMRSEETDEEPHVDETIIAA